MTIIQPVNTSQLLKFIPRYLDTDSELFIWNELRSKYIDFTLNDQYIENGFLIFDISFNFTTGQNFEITIKDSDERLSYNGKAQVL